MSAARGVARSLRWLVAAPALWLGLAHASLGAQPLRVCAEPDNLPFTQREGPPKGFYLELADALGKALDRPVRYVWMDGWGLGGVRVAFSQHRCDVYFGLPAKGGLDAPYLKLTQPFARESYALVVRKGVKVRSFADLKRQRLAVQYGTPPQMLLAVNNIGLLTCDTVAQAMAALARREVNAAFLWGPAAGYYNKNVLRGAYQVLPTSGWGLDWPVAIGVRQDEHELLSALDRQLGSVHVLIEQLQRQYGFPTGAPVMLSAAATELPAAALDGNAAGPAPQAGRFAAQDGEVRVAAADAEPIASDALPERAQPIRAGSRRLTDPSIHPQAVHVGQAARALVVTQAMGGSSGGTAASMSAAALEGRDLFNSRCAHCHGDDAITGNTERSIPDLLKKVPPDQMQAFFIAVVTNGEADQGMPPWRGALSEDQMKKIFVFIRWIQDHPPKD